MINYYFILNAVCVHTIEKVCTYVCALFSMYTAYLHYMVSSVGRYKPLYTYL